MICEGLPNLGILALVDPWIDFSYSRIDADGDGTWDYRGGEGSIDLTEFYFEGGPAYRVQATPREENDLDVIAASVQLARPEVRPVPVDEGVELVFNQPIHVHHLEVKGLLGADDPEFETEIGGDRVRILPGGTSWPEGQLYRVRFVAAPQSAHHDAVDYSFRFLTAAGENPTVKATFEESVADDGALNAGETMIIEFSQALSMTSGTTFDRIPFEIDVDLDSSGIIGDADGEYGFGGGSLLLLNEDADGHHARTFSFSPPGDLPEGVEFVLRFDLAPGYATAFTPFYREEIRVRPQPVPAP